MTFARDFMPQIGPDFVHNLKSRNVPHRLENVKPHTLKASQSEFNHEKVRQMMHVPSKSEKPVVVSNDDHILDGHHRWLADYNKSPKKSMKVLRVDMPILDLIHLTRSFKTTKHKSVVESIRIIVKESRNLQRHK